MPAKGNKGVTVRVNLFALEKHADGINARAARLWMKGKVTNTETGDNKIFNDAGELISILGKWNAAKFKQLRARVT
jgi:hypothetical protein